MPHLSFTLHTMPTAVRLPEGRLGLDLQHLATLKWGMKWNEAMLQISFLFDFFLSALPALPEEQLVSSGKMLVSFHKHCWGEYILLTLQRHDVKKSYEFEGVVLSTAHWVPQHDGSLDLHCGC